MILGERIRERRKNCGLSQEKLAELVGVSRQAVTKWESGQSAPSTENLFRLAEIFSTSVDLLLAEEEPEEEAPLAQQIYRLFQREQEKKDAEHRARRRRNLRRALLTAAGYLAAFLLGRIFCTPFENMSFWGWLWGPDPGQTNSSYLFGWLLSSGMFLIASLISILPSLFGSYRFSGASFAGFVLGFLLGEWLGPYPPGEPYGHGHYGWLIWGGVFLAFASAGILWELLAKRAARRGPA